MTTLLLDADIIAFKVASVSQQTFQFDPEAEPIVQPDDWADVAPRIHSAINAITETLGTTKVIVCLSCPTAENFRLDILPTYKGNRDYSKRPVHLGQIKDYMEANWPSYRRPRLEADDIMGILATSGKYPKAIIVSEDKDMKTIPGWLFNPAKDEKPKLISPQAADRWHLYQTICGDIVDGYAGCPGAGPEKAGLCLDECMFWSSFECPFVRGPRKGTSVTRWTSESMPEAPDWMRLVSLFARYGLTEDDALVQARVARILRACDYDFNEKKPILWTPASNRLPHEAMTA